MLKRTVLHLLILTSCCLALTSIASAQWTVFDPTVYGETVDNYYQMVQSNATLLSQLQQAEQQYQTTLQQLTSLTDLSSYSQLASWTHPSTSFATINPVFPQAAAWTAFFGRGGRTAQPTITQSLIPITASRSLIESTYAPDSSQELEALASNQLIQNAALQDSITALRQTAADTNTRNAFLTQLQVDSTDTSQLTTLQLSQKMELADVLSAQAASDTAQMTTTQVELLNTIVQQQADADASLLNDQAAAQQTAANGTFSSLLAGSANTPGASYLNALTPSAVPPASN